MGGRTKSKFENTFLGKVFSEINEMKVGDTLDKVKFCEQIWGFHDFFIDRTFSVHFVTAKKMLPEREFKTERKIIERTK